MTTTAAVLINFKFAEATQITQYTSTTCKTIIDKLTATNNSAAIATLTINLVASGTAPTAENAIKKDIAPGTTWPFPEIVGHMLEAGGMISTLASIAGVIEVRASGRKIT